MSLKEKILYCLLAITGALAIGWTLLGPSGAREVARLKEEQRKIADEVRQLEDKKDILSRQASLMRDDPRLIERRARDTLGMVKTEETVIMLPGKKRNGD